MKKSVDLLNKAVAIELSNIHQYLCFNFHCDAKGYYLLANVFKRTANDKMKHVERLAKRVLSLQGNLDMMPSQTVQKADNLKDIVVIAEQMEKDSIKNYRKCANECSVILDPVSKQLFDSLKTDEEKYYHQFNTAVRSLGQVEASYSPIY